MMACTTNMQNPVPNPVTGLQDTTRNGTMDMRPDYQGVLISEVS